MQKFSWVIGRIPEYKKLVSICIILIIPVFTVTGYGVMIGGSYLNEKFICYNIVGSLLISFLICLFAFGKAFLKKFYNKEYRERQIWGLLTILLIVLHFLYYSSINKTFVNTDDIKEIEATIIKVEDNYQPKATEPYCAYLYFMGSDGNEYYVEFDYFTDSQDNHTPVVNGKMTVRETKGAFNYPLYEFVEIVS